MEKQTTTKKGGIMFAWRDKKKHMIAMNPFALLCAVVVGEFIVLSSPRSEIKENVY